MKKFLLFALCLSIHIGLFAQNEIPSSLYFDFTDTDGTTHNLSDYISQGKSVFLFEFLSHGDSYVALQDFNLDELYNTYGQGGTNEVVVLCLAGEGFETASDLLNNNYTGDLGPGYEDVSFTDNNPAPIGIIAQNPGTVSNTEEFFILHVLCADNHYTTSDATTADGHMAQLYGVCCVGSESYDPALTSLSFPGLADCNPQEVTYQLSNGTPVPLTACDIDVLINDVLVETIEYTGSIPGCGSEDFDYTNVDLEPGDELTLAISNDNENTDNDVINIDILTVDTVRGQIKMEVINPADPFGYGGFSILPSFKWVDQTTNWYNQIFVQEVGCHQLDYFGAKFGDAEDQALLITSRYEDGSIQDTIVYLTENSFAWNEIRSIYVDTIATPYLWGYVFQDIDETQTYSPDLSGISGVQMSQGANQTYSDADGYYQLPISPDFDIVIDYDESVWPVYTTPLAGFYNPQLSVYNFGLSQSDPSFALDLNFNNGIPFICESQLEQSITLSNSGNQAMDVEVVFTHDPALVVDEISPTPISVNGNEYTFDLGELGFSMTSSIYVKYVDVPVDLIGEFLDTQIDYATYNPNGVLLLEGSFLSIDSLYCAFDPNDIYGFPLGEGPSGLIAADTDLDYRIRFQNTGNAPASNVRVSHFVPEELNWESIVPGPTSHTAVIEMNSETREMTWVFNGINLPDSTTDAAGSQGYVWYKAEMNDLNPGDQIENVAEIYFDQNEAIVTNTSLHTISDVVSVRELEIAELIAYPNPTKDIVNFDLTDLNQVARYSVMDINGRFIQSGNISNTLISIDLSGFETGVYAVMFFSENENLMGRASVLKVE